MRRFNTIRKNHVVDIQVNEDLYEDKLRVDVREWVGTKATPRGIAIPIRLLPQVIASLRMAEDVMIERGLLTRREYVDHGLISPRDLENDD